MDMVDGSPNAPQPTPGADLSALQALPEIERLRAIHAERRRVRDYTRQLTSLYRETCLSLRLCQHLSIRGIASEVGVHHSYVYQVLGPAGQVAAEASS